MYSRKMQNSMKKESEQIPKSEVSQNIFNIIKTKEIIMENTKNIENNSEQNNDFKINENKNNINDNNKDNILIYNKEEEGIINNNRESNKFRQNYYKLLTSKTTEDINNTINIKKEENKDIKNKDDNNHEEKKDFDKKSKDKEGKKEIINKSEINNKREKNKALLDNRNKNKLKFDITPIKSSDNNNKKNILKILELIKNKKIERESIIQTKDEIKRSRSFVDNRKKEKKEQINKEIKNDSNEEYKEKTIKDNNNENYNNDIDIIPSLTNHKIYKKNPNRTGINIPNKSNNYKTEVVNDLNITNDNKNKMPLSPLTLNNSDNNNNLLSATNIKRKIIINKKFQNINKKKYNNTNENQNSINKNKKIRHNCFFQTSNQIKQMQKYEKPRMSTNYNDKSIPKKNNKIINDYETNHKGKYHESLIYSPKKIKLQKIKSENNFKKRNKDQNNNNFYIKKYLFNEKNMSKSNCNIYNNCSNIHNYYNNSKIYLRNKFISIHPSANKYNNNKTDESELSSSHNIKYNKKKKIEHNRKNKNLETEYTNMPRTSEYIYQKNKINKNKNMKIENTLNENVNPYEIDDINLPNLNLRLETEDIPYNYRNNMIKHSILNSGDSYIKNYPGNTINTINNSMKNIHIGKYNHIYNNNTIQDNNNFLGKSSIFYKKKLEKKTIDKTLIYKRNYRLNKNNSIIINIENILIFEEKFNNIISYLKKNVSILKPCLDFWNYYYNSWTSDKIEKIFNDEEDMEIMKMFINYLLLSVMICYYFSLKQEIFNNFNYLLFQILDINYNSIMLIFQHIKNNVFENQNDLFLPILKKIYINYIKNSNNLHNNNLMIIEKIYNNNDIIDTKIKNMLSSKNLDYLNKINNFSRNIKQKNYKEINSFFINFILKEENINASLFSSYYYISNALLFNSVKPPFLKSPNKKKLTLILDLNETLINFKYEENGEGYVRIRPFLFGFLEEVSQLYELIVFTNSEKEYADSVIEAIEKDRTYFDHVFYRQHTIIVGNDFVKDLTRIGRPLNSIIIIDNMPQNYKLQKENGILIKPFWGEDSKDRTLYDLMPILLYIAKEGGDVRYGLNKYRNEIIGKITSNIIKKKFDD